MESRTPQPLPWRSAWIADVLCGAIGGSIFFGRTGALIGVLFMLTAGETYRRRRLHRERQLQALRARAHLRERRAAREAVPS